MFAAPLTHLSSHLDELSQVRKNKLVRFLLEKNTSILENSDVLTHVLQSRSLDAAFGLWEAKKGSGSLISGVREVLGGAISWKLLADKFGFLMTLLIFSVPSLAILAVALWFYKQWLTIKTMQKVAGNSHVD